MQPVNVIFAIPKAQEFTYLTDFPVKLYQRVLAPFGKRKLVGWVISLKADSFLQKSKKINNIKKLIKALDPEPLAKPSYYEWLLWASDYYLTPLGQFLALAHPASLTKDCLSFEDLLKKKARGQKTEVLDADLTPTDLTISKKQARTNIKLNVEQNEAYQTILKTIDPPCFQTFLFFGITGSGKTLVYIELIKQALKKERQVLYLVPEIGLTPQTIRRLQVHFKEDLAVYHSGLTSVKRLTVFRSVVLNKTKVIIGTRSALFMPFQKLGLIIIDEEHDGSFKQEEGIRYHARDLAIVRAKKEAIPIVLGSATPSLESFYHAQNQKYRLLTLTKRHKDASLAEVELIAQQIYRDQTRSPLALCQKLRHGLYENFAKKEQSLVLINKRGFARVCLCQSCHEAIVCPNCDIQLVNHQKTMLACHHCGHSEVMEKNCPSCDQPALTLVGLGTQSVFDEIKELLPKANLLRLDRDTTQTKNQFFNELNLFARGHYDLVVGTQMVAKGHDWPNLTLVGVLEAESQLYAPDFRSFEKTFQLLTQVFGRSGRADKKGRVIVQTFNPKLPLLTQASNHDYVSFYHQEIKNRQKAGYPPFGRLILFEWSALNEKTVKDYLAGIDWRTLKSKFPAVEFLGPEQAVIAKLRNRWRWRLLIKSKNIDQLRNCAYFLKKQSETKPASIRMHVDIDPQSMI